MTDSNLAFKDFAVQDNPYDDDPLNQALKENKENNALRQIGGFGLEIGTGITTDLKTAPLLVTPIPGARVAYGVINFSSGYASNVAAQKIRGDEFSYGEAIAAGLFQMIPFGSTGKGVKGLAGAGLQGAVTAGGETTVRTAIDQQRLPTAGEIGTATAFGTAFGTGFKGSLDFVGSLSSKYGGKSATEIDSLITNEEKLGIDGLIEENNKMKDYFDPRKNRKLPPVSEDGEPLDLPEGFTGIETDEAFDKLFPETRPKLKPFKTNLEQGRGLKGSRGADYLRKRMRMEVNFKRLDSQEAKDVETFMDIIGDDMFENQSISISAKLPKAGQYDFANNLITIRKQIVDGSEQGTGGGFTHTMIHELWHGLSRYLPKEDLTRYTKEFKIAQSKYLKQFETDKTKFIRENNPESLARKIGPSGITGKLPKITEKNYLKKATTHFEGTKFKNENYRYSNIDEFFAENLTDEFIDMLDGVGRSAGRPVEFAPSGTWKRISQEISVFIADLFTSLKARLGGTQTRKIFNDFIKRENVKKYRSYPLDIDNKLGVTDLPTKNGDSYRRPSKPIDPNVNKRLWGSRPEDVDFTDRFLRSEIETNPRYPTSIPDEFAIAEADNILLPELKRRLDYLASRIRGKDDKKALRIQYLSALRHQFRLTQNIVNTTQTLQDAVLNQTDFSDDLLKGLARSYFDILDLVTPTKIIGSEAAGTLRASQLIQQPGTKRIPIDEQVKKGFGGGETPAQRIAADKAGRKNTRQLVEEAQTEAAEKALIPTEDEILDALIRARDTGNIEDLVRLSTQVQAMNGDSKKIGKLFEGMTLGDRALRGLKVTNEIFINSILSAPETHIVNVVGSAFNVALGPVDLFLGSPLTDTVAKGRAVRELVGMLTSTKESFKMAAKAFYLDKNLLDPARQFGQDSSERYAIRMSGDSPQAHVINTIGNLVRLPGRFMMSGDEFVKNIAFRSHLLGKFSEQATLEGLQGQEFKRYVKKNFDKVIEIVNKESVEPGTKKNILDAYIESLDYAADRTFTQELGHGFLKDGVGAGTTKKLASILKSAGMKPIVPFVTTPVNIGKSVLRRTGFQIPGAGKLNNLQLGRLLKEHNDRLYSPDPATRMRAKGEAVTGGLIWTSLITLAMQANDPDSEIALIGGGHHDKYKRGNKLRTGELPYSIRKIKRDENGEIVRSIDGVPEYKYYDVLDRLEPIASMLMIAGDWSQMSAHMELDDEQEAAKALRVLIQRNFSNKYMLQNIGELFEIIDNPTSFDRWMRIPAKYVGSVVGYPSSMLASIKRARGEKWESSNPLNQKTYKGRFAKKKYEIQAGDLTKQEIRADGSLRDKPEVPFVDNGLDTLGLFIMRELADKYSGFSADLEPMVSPTTGQVIERPSGLGTNWFMPLKYGESKGNPIDNFVERAGARLAPPESIILQDDTGDGIKLDTKEYNKFKNLIPFVEIDGKRFPQLLLEMYQDEDIQKMLNVVENGGGDSPDKQADLKLRKRQAKLLRSQITSAYNGYVEAAEDYYKNNMLDPETLKAWEKEQERSINQIISENQN